jgi:hypothetical protein
MLNIVPFDEKRFSIDGTHSAYGYMPEPSCEKSHSPQPVAAATDTFGENRRKLHVITPVETSAFNLI